MRNNTYSITLVLVVWTFCLPSFLSAQLLPTKEAVRHESQQKPDSSNFRSVEEKVLNPSLAQYLSGIKRVFTTKSNLFYLGTGTVASLIVWPYDKDISEAMADDNINEFELQAPNKLGRFFVITGASLFTHLFGRVIHKPHLANTGFYLLEAYFTTVLITTASKMIIQRTRPNGQNNRSFPSGHTSGIFAVASVLDKRYGYKVGIPSYLLAGFVGISRIKMKKHFPTDVIAGAALGTIIGRSFLPSQDKNKSMAVSPAIHWDFVGINLQLHF